MAWLSSGESNEELISNMRSGKLIESDVVADASLALLCRVDSNQTPDAHILDVGSGSGYTAAVFHHLIKINSVAREDTGYQSPSTVPSGGVVGIDHIPALVEWSIENLKKDGLGDAISKGEIVMIAGDGRKGWKKYAPYDVIHVGAAAPQIPQELVDQLKSPGRMFIPVGPDGGDQDVWTVDKDESGNLKKTRLFGVRSAVSSQTCSGNARRQSIDSRALERYIPS
ncbi:16434_t:CDS:2 [Acaulospora colombiana]|uniref:16434_t:CDS:1 n=1 Tax=Acaulospora colombiana TaxID=27376 RepID=A0ACA9N0C3_9GLOM|nr:16434_t:CDS:2 [Acaulospora colombiana]